LDRQDEAVASYRQALESKPDDPVLLLNMSYACLTLGRLAQGWANYDQRFVAETTGIRRPYPRPLWNGERVAGTLLVWGEQGLGEQILHASMIADLHGRADEIVLELDARLVSLFARSFPGTRPVPMADTTPYQGQVDMHVPIASLGRHLRPDWPAFPTPPSAYLLANPVRSQALHERLHGDRRKVIGLSWSSRNAKFEKVKSARLADFQPLLQQSGCRFIDLQYGDTQAERHAVEQELGVRVEHLDDIDNTNDLDSLAALMGACDLIVTVSNTTAHLAGALGRPVNVLIPHGPARWWYWFKDRDDSPWYPNLRIHRQLPEQTWPQLISACLDRGLIGPTTT
jgi:hypothetical protein